MHNKANIEDIKAIKDASGIAFEQLFDLNKEDIIHITNSAI